MLTAVHKAEIEIVPPSFMNHRQMDNTLRILPTQRPSHSPPSNEEPWTRTESLIFDQAQAMVQLEELKDQW